jgi:hypothetical protein
MYEMAGAARTKGYSAEHGAGPRFRLRCQSWPACRKTKHTPPHRSQLLTLEARRPTGACRLSSWVCCCRPRRRCQQAVLACQAHWE